MGPQVVTQKAAAASMYDIGDPIFQHQIALGTRAEELCVVFRTVVQKIAALFQCGQSVPWLP